MKKSGTIASNVLWNVIGFSSALLVSFFISPYVVRTLGNSRYGAWALISELTGYYGLFDLGTRAAVSYFVASYTARNLGGDLRETVASAFSFLAVIGATLVTVGASVILLFPSLVHIQTVPVHETRIAAMIVSLTVGMTLPMDVFASVLTGNKRLDLVNKADLTGRVFSVMAIIVVLRSGGGLIELSMVQALSKAVTWSVNITLARHIEPNLTVSPRWARWARLRELIGFGSKNVAISLTRVAIGRTDLIVTAALLGSAAVTFFHLGRMIGEYFFAGMVSICMAFTMHLTQYHSAGEHDRLRSTYLHGTRLVSMVAAPSLAFIAAFATPFLSLWIGKQYVSGPWTMRSDVVLWILLCAHAVRCVQSMSNQLLYATRDLGYLLRINVTEAVVKVLLSIVLGKYFGLAGIAAGTTIPLGITNVFVIPRYVFAKLGITAGEYWKRGPGTPLLGGVLTYGVSLLVVYLLPPVSWPKFFYAASIAFVGGVAVFAFTGMNAADRQELLARAPEPMRRLLGVEYAREVGAPR